MCLSQGFAVGYELSWDSDDMDGNGILTADLPQSEDVEHIKRHKGKWRHIARCEHLMLDHWS